MYIPLSYPSSFEDVFRELQNVQIAFEQGELNFIKYKEWNAEPDRPRAGMVVYADGTNWNPGSGEGLYIYKSGGSWVLLG